MYGTTGVYSAIGAGVIVVSVTGAARETTTKLRRRRRRRRRRSVISENGRMLSVYISAMVGELLEAELMGRSKLVLSVLDKGI